MSNNLENLVLENQGLKEEIETLKNLIMKMEKENTKSWNEIVDEKVETWFEKFKDDVDIGKITTFELLGKKFEIDVLPDVMEKAIYKKCIKIILAMVIEFKDNL